MGTEGGGGEGSAGGAGGENETLFYICSIKSKKNVFFLFLHQQHLIYHPCE